MPKFYSRQKLLLAFEYALVIADVARTHNVEITPELVKRAEEMLVSEFSKKNPTRLSVDMLPNVLSVFETDLSK